MTRILLIDDDDDVIASLAALLEIYDIDIVGKASNGNEGYKMYKKLNPDAILLDIKMPEFDGSYAMEKIRLEDSKIPICIVTADRNLDTTSKLQKLKPTKIFYKPFEITKIVNTIVSST